MARDKISRRKFLKKTLVAVAGLSGAAVGGSAASKPEAFAAGGKEMPSHGNHAMTENREQSYLDFVCSHLDRLIATGRADFGPDPNDMWMSSVDIHTGRYPEDDRRPEHIPKRCYRYIEAPKGCTLYWDLPQLVAAHAVSKRTGDPKYSHAADAYVRDFFERCVAAPTGLLLWNNHYFWDAFEGCTKEFGASSKPWCVDPAEHMGHHHELRPLPPAWEALWRVDPAKTERAIRAVAKWHVFDLDTGGFNRHANGKEAYSFLEAGGIIAESLCWLAARTGDEELVDLAQRIAHYNFESRDPNTKLMRNQVTRDRWDQHCLTTEVGLWATSLLQAAEYSGRRAFADMARDGIYPYLKYGYDPEARRYYGKLEVTTGKPVRGEKTTRYQPDDYAELWEPLYPTHNYPMAFATACTHFAEVESGPEARDNPFPQGVARWARIVAEETPARGGHGAYAEHYGRAIHFLTDAARRLERPEYLEQARAVADEAVGVLFAQGMFRGHPGEDRYDAVDGVGFLSLALLELESDEPLDLLGFHF